jgi:cytochrome oxidase assembly protein ShyY1
LGLLRTGRWLAFTATAVAAIVAFGMLSLWQWHRAEEKRAEFAPIESAMNSPAVRLDAEPGSPGVPADGRQPGADTATRDWQRVTVTGTFDQERQVLVRNRPQDGSNGFQVLGLLTIDGGEGIWVVRGFMPASGAASASTQAPDPPSGEVTLTGYLRASEQAPARPAQDIPAGQVSAINAADLDALEGVTTGGWYVLAASDPALKPVPLPGPTDVRNLSYAGQWLLFAAIVVGGWFFFLRREAREEAEASAPEQEHPITAGR